MASPSSAPSLPGSSPGSLPDTLFREEQRLTQLWVRAICLGIAAMAWVTFVNHVFVRGGVGKDVGADLAVAVLLLVAGIGLPWLMARTRLVTEVGPDAIRLRYFPFARRAFDLADLERVEPTTFRPLRDHLGWGLRWTPWGGAAWTVSGNRGVRLVRRDGPDFVVGSQRPEDLAAALHAAGVA